MTGLLLYAKLNHSFKMSALFAVVKERNFCTCAPVPYTLCPTRGGTMVCREYQFWERNPLSIELRTDKVYRQKLDYIHWNPVRAEICTIPDEYKYSSPLFYETGVDNWGFLSHHGINIVRLLMEILHKLSTPAMAQSHFFSTYERTLQQCGW
jgi:hypothetical protein